MVREYEEVQAAIERRQAQVKAWREGAGSAIEEPVADEVEPEAELEPEEALVASAAEEVTAITNSAIKVEEVIERDPPAVPEKEELKEEVKPKPAAKKTPAKAKADDDAEGS